FLCLLFVSRLYLPTLPTRRSSDLYDIPSLTFSGFAAFRISSFSAASDKVSFTIFNESLNITLFFYKNKKRDALGHLSLQNIYVLDRKSTRLNSSHVKTSYAVFCLK